jgi:enamine deaminase RidA (YjgF/YER057c/UK114 family)
LELQARPGESAFPRFSAQAYAGGSEWLFAAPAAVDERWNLKRQLISSGKPWESQVGYSRAVRVGPFVHVAGTTGTNEDGTVVSQDPYQQSRKALENIAAALDAAGVSMADVVRTRIYVTDIAQWEAIARAHSEFFQNVRPAATMVEVRRLIAPEILVEIEADAIVSDSIVSGAVRE